MMTWGGLEHLCVPTMKQSPSTKGAKAKPLCFPYWHSAFSLSEGAAVSNRKGKILIRSIYCKWSLWTSKEVFGTALLGEVQGGKFLPEPPKHTRKGQGIEKNAIIWQEMKEKS